MITALNDGSTCTMRRETAQHVPVTLTDKSQPSFAAGHEGIG